MERYNKYHEMLYIDCECKKPKKNPCDCEKLDINPCKKKNTNPCDCGGVNLPSYDNELEICIRQLKKEVAELLKTTQAKLLCQDKKIAETMVYIKNNLSNALRELLNSMLESGQLEELITSVVSNSIEVLESDVEQLKTDVTQLKAQSTANSNDIVTLKGKMIEFTSTSDDNIDTKFLNVDINTEYVNDSILYITKIRNLEKLSCLPTNNDVTKDVNLDKRNIIDYSKINNDYDLYINAGMSGIYIFDGVVNTTTRLDCPYYCGFNNNNDMKFYNGLNNTITAQDLINDGIVNCFSGFAPLIVNHNLADYSDLESLYNSNEIAKNFIDSLPVKHPRQILAQDDDNNFYIISVMGRFNNSKGLNYDEMKQYCYSKGYKNAFNCDGGGSMQTVYNKNYIFYPSQELDTNVDRLVPSTLGFKIMEVE